MAKVLIGLAVGCVPWCNSYCCTDRFLGNAPCSFIEASDCQL